MRNFILSTISILGVTTTSYAAHWSTYSYHKNSEKKAEKSEQPMADAVAETSPVLEMVATDPEVIPEFMDPDIAYSTAKQKKEAQRKEEKRSRLCSERFWVSADYLLAWEKDMELDVPLITTGSAADPVPGAIGQPGTKVVFGKHDIDFERMQGVKVGAGGYFGDDRELSVDLEAFWIFPGTKKVEKESDASGNPVIARPFYNAGQSGGAGVANSEYAVPISAPAPTGLQGSSKGSARSHIMGVETNVGYRPCEGSVAGNLFVGFRYLRLSENIIVKDRKQFTADAVDPIFFNGFSITPPNSDVFKDKDSFETTNNFYGGQIGGKLTFSNNRWFDCTIFGKIAIGGTHENVEIEGSSTWQSAAFGKEMASGGILALPTNSGDYDRWRIGYVPEGGFNFSVGPIIGLRFHVGYSFLYMNRVARPGKQIDHESDLGLIPLNSVDSLGGAGGFYTPGAEDPQHPKFHFEDESYWLQTANFGVSFDF